MFTFYLNQERIKFYPLLFEFKQAEFFTSHGGYLLNTGHTLSFWCGIFSSRSRSPKIRLLSINLRLDFEIKAQSEVSQ